MKLEVKAQEDKPITGKYFLVLFEDGKEISKDRVMPFPDEKEKEFILRISAEISKVNIGIKEESVGKPTSKSLRLIHVED